MNVILHSRCWRRCCWAPCTVAVAAPMRRKRRKPRSAVDRLQLDATAITGNRELPKVMSIVPWKAAEPPAGPDRPMGSLIDEVLCAGRS